MTYLPSFYFQIAASITSIFFLIKVNNKRIMRFIPITLLISSFIFKPHLQGDNLLLVKFYENELITLDNKYFFLNFLFNIFGANWIIFFVFQILASICILYLINSIPKELSKDKIKGLKKSIHIPSIVFIVFNYIIIATSKLSTYHPRQFLSTTILVYCLYQIYISQKNSKNINFRTLLFSLLATFIHLSGLITSLFILYFYLKNNSFFSLSRIKIVFIKENLFKKYLNIFLIITAIIFLTSYIQIIFKFLIFLMSNLIGIRAYSIEVDYYDRNIFGFTLPIIYLIPLIIYTSKIPFTNLLKKASNDINLSKFYFYLNLYSFSSIGIIALELSVNYYSIGRVKTILLPLLFFIIFHITTKNKSIVLKKGSLFIIYILSMYSVYRSYSQLL